MYLLFLTAALFGAIALIAYLFFYLARLNKTASALKQGLSPEPISGSSLPVIKQTTGHFASLANAYNDLQKMEEYQQKMLSFEKREMAYLLEKEDLARKLELQLEETRLANQTVSDLNIDLEAKNVSLNEAINRLSSLNQISRMLGMEHDRKQIYKMVVSLPHDLMDAEIGHLLLDNGDGELVVEYSLGLPEDLGHKRSIPFENGIAGWVANNRKSLLVEDFSKQDIFSHQSSIGYERRSAVSAPIMIKDNMIGVITLINKKNSGSFSDDDKTLLATIASEAAMALNNALLMEKVQKSYFSMIQSLIVAVESKDVYTRGHSDRVTQYSMLIAENMGLSMDDLEALQQAAVLHDIGKITVELSILNKPTGLNYDEFNKIKLHPLVGYRILEPIDFEDKVKLCVLQHHERLDGKGYPNAIKSDDILIEAKILTIADAFDAMITRRPYREPLSIDAAIREMEKFSGTQFDGEIVNVFKGVLHNMTSGGIIERMIS